MMILKVTKSQGFTLCLEVTFLEKPQGGQIDQSRFPRVLRVNNFQNMYWEVDGLDPTHFLSASKLAW